MLIEIPRIPSFSQTVGVEPEPLRLPLTVSYRRSANLGAACADAVMATFFSAFAATPMLVKLSPCATVWDYLFLPVVASVFGAFAVFYWLSAAAFARYAFTRGTILTITDIGVSMGRLGVDIEWADVARADLNQPCLLLTLRSQTPQGKRSKIEVASELAQRIRHFVKNNRWPNSSQIFLAQGHFDVSSWRLAHVVALFVAKAGGDVEFSQPRAYVISAPTQ